MAYKKILTIQDISCVGQCSLTVALPILSACGLETCILPSAVLSTHTAGFSGFTFRDLTDDMPEIQKHWQKENIKFSAIYTGYLGSVKQVGYVQNILDTMGTDDCVRIVDPAMADNGKLYSIFDDEYVAAMRGLCKSADILVPNITEACFLAEVEYRESYDDKYIKELLNKLSRLGAKTIVLTGVSYAPEKTGVIVYENGAIRYYEHNKVSKGCHGTGDIYASAFTGALMNGKEIFEAAKIAADYTVKCIINTQGDPDHWYGAKFETALGDLMNMLA
ncbi:MAG: pyridoxamine kinase [Clostridia bacterium]|nr:pyridoxamine kinase [Clostridia bacterium]MBR3806438.1 pyridoxamine kinase [Clostridia bacterium]